GDRLLRTTDGGVTVTPITAATQAIFAAAFASPSRVVAAGAGGATVVSDDGGINYTPIGTDIGATYVSMRHGPSPQIAYALGRNGQLARTTDRGATWRKITLPNPSKRKRSPLRVRDVDFVDARAGWLLDDAGRLWATRDGGRSWAEIAATGSDDAQSIAFGSRTEGWL